MIGTAEGAERRLIDLPTASEDFRRRGCDGYRTDLIPDNLIRVVYESCTNDCPTRQARHIRLQ
jgi:hypothetical protein